MNFSERRKEAEKAGLLSSGDYLKLKEGPNRFRLMSECVPHESSYQGKRNFKWLCYVLDRVDGKVKPYFMPHTVYKQIEALQLNDDYAFADVPMPYDLTVNAKNAGTKEVEYTIVPARKESALNADEMSRLHAAKPLRELKTALDEKQQAAEQPAHHQQIPHPAADYDDENPPF